MFLHFLFIASTILTIGGALMVAATKNLMHACIYLLASLIGVAGLYATLGADFVAVTQIMVYVGGVVILMVFAVMLTGGKDFKSKAQQLMGLAPSMGNTWTYVVGGLVAVVFLLTNIYLIGRLGIMSGLKNDGAFPATVRDIGHLLIKDHVLAFEMSSVLLLGSLVGAAIIARPRKQ